MKHLLSALLITLPIYLLAQYSEQIHTERPLMTGNPFTVGKSVLQVEGGYTFGYSPVGARINTHTLELLLRYGLTERLELYAGLDQNWWSFEQVRIGAPDRALYNLGGLTNVGFKLNLFTDLGLISNLSIQSEVRMPSVKYNNLVDSRYHSVSMLKGDIPIGKRWDIRMSAGLGFFFHEESFGRETVQYYAIATTFDVGSHWTTWLELNLSDYAAQTTGLRGGAIYRVRDNLQFDLSLGYVSDWLSNLYTGSVGAAYRLNWR